MIHFKFVFQLTMISVFQNCYFPLFVSEARLNAEKVRWYVFLLAFLLVLFLTLFVFCSCVCLACVCVGVSVLYIVGPRGRFRPGGCVGDSLGRDQDERAHRNPPHEVLNNACEVGIPCVLCACVCVCVLSLSNLCFKK